ncbi:MAG: Asp-tRNA(Asn)/Glu-tRNA(Gln) amidotransferase subunit GatA [Lentisphaeria bacterium]|nr:Asp-tRNA(Asn)/Glu-tRNA(Gln) amidotransferase subunit GatA [Lentisphaeria bacterium]
MDLSEKNRQTLLGLAGDLKAKKISSVELVNECFKKIDERDNTVKAFLSVDREAALKAAEEADKRRAEGKSLSDFDGIPVGIKDNIAVRGETLSCASKLLKPVVSPYDATAVARLRDKGIIPFGRLNMDEFAMGSSCENSAFQKTCNPCDTERVPGGSSGGSAAAVAAGLVPATLGSDTGGSIRQPAAFCGTVGLKPTYGRISRYGLVAFASSLDQISPLSNSVTDAAALLDIMAGVDRMDSTSLDAAAPNALASALSGAASGSLKGVRIGLPEEYFASGLSSGVDKVMQNSIELAKSMGAELVKVSLPHTKYAVAVYYIVATAEASANLARFDGIRYGDRKEGRDLIDTYFKSRGAGFGDEVKRRILLGTYVLSSGYYDAYYLRAQKVRTLIRKDFEEAYKQCDILLTPVTPNAAFKFGEKSDPLQMYLSDIFTIALNLSGDCGVSVPGGKDEATGMPVGVQFLAPALGEAKLLGAAAAFEAALK